MTRSVLILKCVGPNGEAYKSFRWPLEVGATVTAPDWDPSPTCGGGLHGWLYGEGDLTKKRVNLDLNDPLNKWLVLEALATDVIEFDRKCKARSVTIIFVGERSAAATYIAERHRDKCVHYATITAGSCGTATAGSCGTATAGEGGTATAGEGGTATAGNRGTINFLYWDTQRNKWRTKSFEVGEGDVKPNVKYRLNQDTLQPEEVPA